MNDSYSISLIHKVKFGQNNFTPFENNIQNITIPTITQFNKSKDLEILDFNQNQYNNVQSIVNLENILILSIAIVFSSIITLSTLVIFTRVKKCLSTKNNCNTNVKSNQVPVTMELDHKHRKFPTRFYNDIEIIDYELYLKDLKECI